MKTTAPLSAAILAFSVASGYASAGVETDGTKTMYTGESGRAAFIAKKESKIESLLQAQVEDYSDSRARAIVSLEQQLEEIRELANTPSKDTDLDDRASMKSTPWWDQRNSSTWKHYAPQDCSAGSWSVTTDFRPVSDPTRNHIAQAIMTSRDQSDFGPPAPWGVDKVYRSVRVMINDTYTDSDSAFMTGFYEVDRSTIQANVATGYMFPGDCEMEAEHVMQSFCTSSGNGQSFIAVTYTQSCLGLINKTPISTNISY